MSHYNNLNVWCVCCAVHAIEKCFVCVRVTVDCLTYTIFCRQTTLAAFLFASFSFHFLLFYYSMLPYTHTQHYTHRHQSTTYYSHCEHKGNL